MKTKLNFGMFVILLTFLGAYLENNILANQQIVIQFSDASISSEDSENTISIVKKQLQSIGVSNIQIRQNDNGQLKITYYSDADVERIQNILSKEKNLKLAFKSDSDNSNGYPENRSQNDYELNISEIQNNSDVNWDFERTEVVELNQKSEHSYNPKVNTSGKQLNTEYNNSIVKVALQVNKAVTIATDDRSYRIPEVRAGPSKRGFLI